MYLLLLISAAVAARSDPSAVPWGWIGLAALLVFLYVGTFYGAARGKTLPKNEEPTSSPRPPRVALTLIAAVVIFLILDGAVFHTSLYTSVLLPRSFAGRVQAVVTRERQRPPTTARNVLVLGDSRVTEGFAAQQANAAAGPGWEFINGAVPGLTACTWYYMLREIDPDKNRYFAIILPVEYRDVEPRPAPADRPGEYLEKTRDIHLAAPLLRYTDAISFASSYGSWTNRYRAFAACVLRGFAYQSDVLDLVEHPFERVKRLGQADKTAHAQETYAGSKQNLVGVQYDPKSETITTPPQVTPAVKAMLERSIAKRTPQGSADWVAYRKRWVGAILRRYANSETRIVLMQLPRGPFVRPAASPAEESSTMGELIQNPSTVVLSQDRFADLESPEFFFDALHPNALGRQRITDALVQELVQRFPPETEGERQPAPDASPR